MGLIIDKNTETFPTSASWGSESALRVLTRDGVVKTAGLPAAVGVSRRALERLPQSEESCDDAYSLPDKGTALSLWPTLSLFFRVP